MADPLTRELLARLDAQDAQLAAVQAQLARQGRRRRIPRRMAPVFAAILLVALLPLTILAANPFNDLTGGVHDANIDAIYNAGITTGCDPNVRYCPTDLVTRQEMASFLARTAGLGGNPPVANAKTAQTAGSATNATNAAHATSADTATTANNATNATNAGNAGNANTVGGYAPSGLVRVARNAVFGFPATPITAAFESATWTPLVTVTITAPDAGFVLVNSATTGRADASACDGSTSGLACTLTVRLRDTASVTVVSPFQAIVVNNQTGGNLLGALAPTYVFPVTAGAHTFVLEGSSRDSVSAYNSTITALFVPFGYNGGTTLAPTP